MRLGLGIALAVVMAGVFLADARSGVDWEFLQTKHYWSAESWYYGGYAGQYFETPSGYRAFISEGLSNYTNIAGLQERVGPGGARHPIQGFPGTERLATPFLLSVLLHLPGSAGNAWRVFWLANVLLWILSVFLAYRVAALFFPGSGAPFFAAILVALYPALTLTFNAIKQQPLGTTYLLGGIYLFEARLRGRGALFGLAVLTALLFFGQFADGGWCFLAAFLLLRAFWLPGRERWITLLSVVAAVGLSGLWFAWLSHAYRLPSALHARGFSPMGMMAESSRWFGSLVSGAGVSGSRFLNYPGFTFFTDFWPLICRAFLTINAPLAAVAVAGLFLEARTRMFTFLTVPLLFVGQAGMIAAGWVFHYGYLSFPAAVMLILAASGVLGSLVERPAILPRVAALVVGAYACWCFADLKEQAGLYFGGDPSSYQRRIEVHFGDEDGRATY
jgi:hypothetical protein